MPYFDISIVSKSSVKSEGIWVVKAKSKKKAKAKFKRKKIAKLFDIVDVKKHKPLPGEEC